MWLAALNPPQPLILATPLPVACTERQVDFSLNLTLSSAHPQIISRTLLWQGAGIWPLPQKSGCSMPVYRRLSTSKGNAHHLNCSPNQFGDARAEAGRLAQGMFIFLPQKEGIEVKNIKAWPSSWQYASGMDYSMVSRELWATKQWVETPTPNSPFIWEETQ